MPRPRSRWRVGAILLFLLGMLVTAGAPGIGAQAITCADFNNPAAAQILLDADPDMADTLDPDGDGAACNEPTDLGDASSYLDTIQDELTIIQDSLDEWEDIQLEFADPMLGDSRKQELSIELADIHEWWRDYPEVAADIDAPDGYDDIHDAYLDLADMLREVSILFEDAVNANPGSDEHEQTIDAITDTYYEAVEAAADLQDQLDAARGEEVRADATDADAYLAAAQDHLDALTESVDTIEDLLDSGTPLDPDSAEVREIIDLWENAETTVDAMTPPDGYEDVHNAWEDLAAAHVLAADAFHAWEDAGRDERDDLLKDFSDAVAVADRLATEFEDDLADAGA